MLLNSYKNEIVHWGRGVGVVIKKYLSYRTVKIAKNLHRSSVCTNVYDIQVSQKSFFFLNFFEYVVIKRNNCNNSDDSI